MSSVKGKTDQDMRKRIEARLPQPAQFFAGKEDALDKIKLTEAFFNQEINSIRVQLSRPLKFTRKTELTSDLAKFTAVRDGYTALRKSFERRFKQIDVGGRPQDVDVNEFINVTPER
jgi:DNA helicase IV